MTFLICVALVIAAVLSTLLGIFLLDSSGKNNSGPLDVFAKRRNGTSCVFFAIFLMIVMVCLIL